MRTGSISRILILVLATLTMVVVNGQGCSGMFPTERLNPNAKGNGGGYGGLRSTLGGSYGTTDGNQSAPLFLVPMYSVGDQQTCTTYPTGWETVGPKLTGIISFTPQGSPQYAPSACAAKSSIYPTEIRAADFNREIAIFRDDIYQVIDASPPALSQLREPVAYCLSSSKDSGFDVGSDVLLYKTSQGIFAEMKMGRRTDPHFTQFYVDPFAVRLSQQVGQDLYSADGFHLSIAKSALSKAASGSLTATVDGAASTISMSCWVAAR